MESVRARTVAFPVTFESPSIETGGELSVKVHHHSGGHEWTYRELDHQEKFTIEVGGDVYMKGRLAGSLAHFSHRKIVAICISGEKIGDVRYFEPSQIVHKVK